MNEITNQLAGNPDALRDALFGAALLVVPVAAQTAVACLRAALARLEVRLAENTRITRDNNTTGKEIKAELRALRARVDALETQRTQRERTPETP
jgi:hypothetical protein